MELKKAVDDELCNRLWASQQGCVHLSSSSHTHTFAPSFSLIVLVSLSLFPTVTYARTHTHLPLPGCSHTSQSPLLQVIELRD